MLQDCHPGYSWHQMYSEPGDFGFSATARKRTWVIGSNDNRNICRADPYELLDEIKIAMKDVHVRVRDYLVASEAEVHMEALRVANLKRMDNFRPGIDPMSLLLNLREVQTMSELNQKYHSRTGFPAETDRDLAYFLGDSATYCSWSAASGKLPTYRLTQGRFWLPAVQRWLTSKERLCSMGYPVVKEMSLGMGQVPLVGAVDPEKAAERLGNAMHFTTSGIFQCIALSCFGPQ